jgi:penicillin amidase
MALRRARVRLVRTSVLAVAVILTLIWWWPRSVLPPLDGRRPLAGLHRPVEVRFDAFGIPHIAAQSSGDAWMAVGYLQARDRLWQMELYRRAASGRLAELLGENLVPIDQRFLTLGLHRAAELEWARAAPDVRQALERYTAGVNAAIAACGWWKLPLELQLLRVRPSPWTPVDSLAIGKLFAWRLGENHAAELLRYALAQELGARGEDLLGVRGKGLLGVRGKGRGVNDQRPGVASALALHAFPFAPAASSTLPAGLQWLSDDHHAASNSWVISGARTARGRPLLANDPHLTIEMPSVWWEVHVTADADAPGPPLNVTGVTIPGIPFVLIGHNDRIGWGVTNSGADVQDLYVERLDPARRHYLSAEAGGTWEPLTTTHYDIRVKGRRDPLPFDVRETAHGPVMNADDWRDPLPGTTPLSGSLSETVLALRWEAVRQGESAGAFLALARAGNWDAFVAAVRGFSAPSQNFAYADVDGNIGYAMSGFVPLRKSGDGTFPIPGWTSDSEWQGFIPLDQLPVARNPPSGQIINANNEVDPQFPLFLTRDWVAPFRAARIAQMLDPASKPGGLDIAAMQRMQADIRSLSAEAILKALGDAVPDELRQWRCEVDGGAASAFYEAFEEALWRRTFADDMSPALYDRFYRYAANERFAGLHIIINDPDSPWFDDRSTPNVRERRDDVARLAASDARAVLNRLFGASSSWHWDRMHAVKFSHALSGGGRVLDWFFSRGPIPVAGDGMTVNKTATNLRRPYETSEAASYRQILDVGAWDRSLAVNTAGESGHPASPHYFDQNPLWREGRYHPVPFSPAAVEVATVSQLELVP